MLRGGPLPGMGIYECNDCGNINLYSLDLALPPCRFCNGIDYTIFVPVQPPSQSIPPKGIQG